MEKWRDIPGYEGLYSVSDMGRVKSYKRIKSGKIMRQQTRKNHPYLMLQLRKDKLYKHFLVHRLVAMAFLANDSNLPEVNHRDCNARNNSLKNLEWISSSDNTKHSFTHGKADHRGEKNSNAKLNESIVLDIRNKHDIGYSYSKIADMFNISKSTVAYIIQGKTWKNI